MAMSPTELEDEVFDLEGIRIIVRAPRGTQLGDYSYARKAAGVATLAHWLGQRVLPLTAGHEVVVINGAGERPHGKTSLSKLRDSYAT
ncbi:MAG: hypothetical protein AB1429_10010 [Pseudomonadota bacterium]|jgi:hypothetical protein